MTTMNKRKKKKKKKPFFLFATLRLIALDLGTNSATFLFRLFLGI